MSAIANTMANEIMRERGLVPKAGEPLPPPLFLGEKPQVEQCAFLRDIGDHNVVKRARRIIVPPEVISKAKELATARGYDPDRVVPGNLPEFSAQH